MKTPHKASPPVPVEVLAANFEHQLVETARRCIAMRRQFPGVVCRWRRAARTGPHADLALVFIWREGKPPETQVWPYARIEQLAAEVTDVEVSVELSRWARTGDADASE